MRINIRNMLKLVQFLFLLLAASSLPVDLFSQTSRPELDFADSVYEWCLFTDAGAPADSNLAAVFITARATGKISVASGSQSMDLLIFRKVAKLNQTTYSDQTVITPLDHFQHPATVFAELKLQQNNDSSIFLKSALSADRLLFENNNEDTCSLKATYTEDDLWNRIHIDPQTLPLGKISMIPSLEQIIANYPPQALSATAQLNLQINDDGSEWYRYTLRYPETGRTLEFTIQSEQPYQLLHFRQKSQDNPKGQTEFFLSPCVPISGMENATAEEIWNQAKQMLKKKR